MAVKTIVRGRAPVIPQAQQYPFTWDIWDGATADPILPLPARLDLEPFELVATILDSPGTDCTVDVLVKPAYAGSGARPPAHSVLAAPPFTIPAGATDQVLTTGIVSGLVLHGPNAAGAVSDSVQASIVSGDGSASFSLVLNCKVAVRQSTDPILTSTGLLLVL